MNIESTTYQYYSHWLGMDICDKTKGFYLVYNQDRDNMPKGYSCPMDIFAYLCADLLIISYGNRAKEKIEKIIHAIKGIADIDCIKSLFADIFSTNVHHGIKYIYKNKKESQIEAEILKANHIELFLDFFKSNNQNLKDYLWVKEYYLDMVSKHYCHGIILDEKLVSATDAPDMPYMQELVQEMGINTLAEHRGKGFARAVCISFINELLSKGVCPLWSTGNNNVASDRLAYSIGFEKLADILTLTISG
ncbi:MAG: GNAT family N-acetyltransferase [Treponema sp.]|jgi:hypothetical protein|nr:GNAT family N-acetyltransferase [Treponema sp.]